MPLLTLDKGCLAFGHVALLDHADFQVDAGERVALIGRNGSGKSSLLRALAGVAALDDGRLWRRDGLRVAWVPQEPDFPPEQTAYEAVATPFTYLVVNFLKRKEGMDTYDYKTRFNPLLISE